MRSSLLSKSWPYLAIILAHLIWGVNFVIAKLTLEEIPPMSLSLLRFVLALLLLLPFLLTSPDKTKLVRKDLVWLFAGGIFMITLNIGFFYFGLARTTVTNASILSLTIPIFSVLAGWRILKEKIFVVNLVGIVIGLIGAVLVIGLPFATLGISSWSSDTMVGNLLIILSALSWVTGALISKKMLHKYSTLTITALIFSVGVLTFLIPAINEYLQDPAWPTRLTFLGIFGLFFIAIASSISAYFLFEWGLSKVGLIKADLFQYIEPLIAIGLGVLILGEGLRLSLLVGAVLIGLGAYWGTLIQPEHKHHKAHRN